MEAKIRHLEMIRAAISEAAGNSLRIKVFAMLLLAGSLALTLQEGTGELPLPLGTILILITVSLMFLDFYYVWQSDLFKMLYNEVQTRSEDDIDFLMEVDQYSRELYQRYKEVWPFPVVAAIYLYIFIMMILVIGMLPTN